MPYSTPNPQLIVFALNSQPVPSYQLKPSRRRMVYTY